MSVKSVKSNKKCNKKGIKLKKGAKTNKNITSNL